MIANPQFIDIELKKDIASAVDEFAKQKKLEGIKSLSRHNPKKVGLILYLWSQGVSQSQMVKKYHLSHGTIKSTLIKYADYTGKWAELGSKLSKMLFLDLHSLEEEMIEQVRERLHSGELKPTFRDLMYISIALDKAWQQADRARDRSEEVKPERPMVTQQDYEDTLAAAKARMAELKKKEGAEAVDY
jgi:hypothetical protein